MKNYFSLFLLTLFLFSSCKKDAPLILTPDNTISGPLVNYEPEIENITGNLNGQVLNEDGNTVRGARVTMNGQVKITDIYGYFNFSNVTMNAKGTFVEVNADDYFQGSRRFFPRQDATTRVNIKMLHKEFDKSFDGTSGGTVSFESAEVIFPARSIRTETGEDYTGNVNFSGKWLNPMARDIDQIMPGNLLGVNSNSNAVALQTLGMIAVELQDDAGNELNIQTGKTAQIRIPVPTELLDNAPMQIPLWYFNEIAGIWVEEGSATLQDGFYIGEVSHFSFWNCDIPTDYVILSLQIIDPTGQGLSNQTVDINSENYGSGSGITDSDGFVSGIVPANEELNCSVTDYSSNCSEYFDFVVEALSEDTDLGAISVNNPEAITTTISGSLVDCNGELISNGYLQMIVNGNLQVYNYLGTDFEYTFVNCFAPNSWSVGGLDIVNQTSSTYIEVVAGGNTDLSSLSVCEELSEFDYMTVNIDGEFVDNYLISYTYISGDSTYFSLYGNNASVNFHFPATTSGNYANNNHCSYRKNIASYNLSGTLSELTVTQATENRQMGLFSGELENFAVEGETVFFEGEFLITTE